MSYCENNKNLRVAADVTGNVIRWKFFILFVKKRPTICRELGQVCTTLYRTILHLRQMKKNRFWQSFFVMALSLFVVKTVLASDEPAKRSITLSVIDDSPQIQILREALFGAYGKLDISVQYVKMPILRSLVESDAGRIDGIQLGSKSIELSATHLQKIDVPLMNYSLSVVTLTESNEAPPNLDAVSKLASVGIVRGQKQIEILTQGWPSIIVCNDAMSAIRMLKAGRMSAILAGTSEVSVAIKKDRLDPLQFTSKEMLQIPLFHYINKTNTTLIPLISVELGKIKGNSATVLDALMTNRRVDLVK